MAKYRSLAEIGDAPDELRVHELLKLLNEYGGMVEPLPDVDEMNNVMEQVSGWLNELKALVPIVTVGVADGHATYLVSRWPKGQDGWMIFIWVEGGFDRYVSHWGLVVAIPGENGVKMLKRHNALEKLFSLEVVA